MYSHHPTSTSTAREQRDKWTEDRSSKRLVDQPTVLYPRQPLAPSGMAAARNLLSTGQQLQERRTDCWKVVVEFGHKATQVGQELGEKALRCASAVARKDPAAAHEALGKTWSRGVDMTCQVWENAKPQLINCLPEDRGPLWVCSVVAVVVCLAISGLRNDPKQIGESKKVESFLITAQRIQLPDGRYIAYREQGVTAEMARHSILVVHGFPSSRLAGIPGVKDALLWEFGIRIIAYDRPGFGESDPHPRRSLRSSAQDMVHIADSLEIGEKFWVLGYSAGGIHTWSAIKYIPERLAGVAMFAPGGNPYTVNMTKEEVDKIWHVLTLRRKLMFILARQAPSLLRSFYQRTLIKNSGKINNGLSVTVGKKDQVLVEQEYFIQELNRDVQESIRQRNAATLAEEMIMLVGDWGFQLSDLRMRKKKIQPMGFLQQFKSLLWQELQEEWEGYAGPIHIWQGTDDRLVPISMNEFAARMVPQATFHKLEGEGHFSFFCFCDQCHHEIFETLFGNPEGPRNSDTSADPVFNEKK